MFRNLLFSSTTAILGVSIGVKNKERIEFWMSNFINNKDEAIDVNNSKDLLNKAIKLTKNAGEFAVLSTIDSENKVQSRMIQPFEIEENNNNDDDDVDDNNNNNHITTKNDNNTTINNPVVYFNTNLKSRKFKQMKNNNNVTLTYLLPTQMACVTLIGTVEEIPYPASTKHWQSWLTVFYPEGNNPNNGSRFTTWKLSPNKIQLVSVTDGLISKRQDWKPPELIKKDNNWEIFCNGQEEAE